MKKADKIALVRVLTDLIKADNVINSGEMMLFHETLKLYDIGAAEQKKADAMTLASAVEILKVLDVEKKKVVYDILRRIAFSGGYCSRGEYLLLVAMEHVLFDDQADHWQVISIENEDLSLVNSQILFVETGYKNNVNNDINSNYRQISNELRLAGFDFIYIPYIISHFGKSQTKMLENCISFFAPQSSPDQTEVYTQRFLQMTTAGFCRDQLQYKLRIGADDEIQPALLFNIGLSQVEDNTYLNFFKLNLTDRVVREVTRFADYFSPFQRSTNSHIGTLIGGDDRVVYTGFCKMMFDKHLLRSGVQSSIVIDIRNGEILFSEINETLSGVHRREKALYTLFLIESDSGGINFNKPDSVQQYKEYTLQMELLQKKYNAIYRIFGGEIENAPDLSISEIRLPMISRIKRSITKLEGRLHNIDDYLIRRYKSGVYTISISRDAILSSDSRFKSPVQIALSEEFGRIKRFK